MVLQIRIGRSWSFGTSEFFLTSLCATECHCCSAPAARCTPIIDPLEGEREGERGRGEGESSDFGDSMKLKSGTDHCHCRALPTSIEIMYTRIPIITRSVCRPFSPIKWIEPLFDLLTPNNYFKRNLAPTFRYVVHRITEMKGILLCFHISSHWEVFLSLWCEVPTTEYISESCLAPTISIRGSKSPNAVKPLTFGSVYTSLSRKAFAVMAEVRVWQVSWLMMRNHCSSTNKIKGGIGIEGHIFVMLEFS